MRRVLTWACVCFLLWIFTPTVLSAKAEKTPEDSAMEQLERLDLEELKEYLESLGFTGENVSERLKEYIRGGGVDYADFFQGMFSVFFGRVGELLPVFSTIAALSVVSGVLNAVKSNFIGNSTSEIVFFATFVAVLAPVLSVLLECFSMTKESVLSVKKQVEVLFPPLITLIAASGGSVSAAIFQPAVAFLSTTIVQIVTVVVLPVTVTIVAFSIVGNLSPDIKLKRFSAFFKSLNKWVIGVSVSVFGMFFTVQGLTSAAYDGVARRAAKYAIGTGVPILGGFLAGGFDLAMAGGILVKNALGTLGLLSAAYVLFEPLIFLIAVNLLLKLTAAITEPLGDKRVSDFLEETAGNLNYCTASLLFVGFLYLVVIILAVCATEVII